MTEQSQPTNAQPESQDVRVQWPDAAQPVTGDAAVDALLVRLDGLPGLPVSAHSEVYEGLHNGLVEALNEDVAAQATGDPHP
ncbi:hypothetical protein [Arthrobacter sp. B3I4]|uniref:hypothetical protein n=1 Tax=Arthrobacter sp. B3I4 TaxID=3042267 RepID=UPI00277DEFAA|nr:hypothetical protein [Arthrobacter sp. B3I4]MDQ0756855.1 hypothetical protein [Arthrobacter sp. B3I4]